MSFTTEVKEELSALIRIEGTLLLSGMGQYRLEVATDAPVVARFVIKALHEIFGLKTDLTMRRSVLHKTPNWLIEVPSQKGLNAALRVLGVLDKEGHLERGVSKDLVKKRCCSAAYLRGVFLGSGFIANPKGDFHFEITVETQTMANDVVELMASAGIVAKVTERRNSFTIYLKSGSAISSFLALVGAHQCALKMENERVLKSVRNDVNRRVNAEIANQAKTAQASIGQIKTIRHVLEHHDIKTLPKALQDYIRLRVSYPDASLKELGEMANPPLSKSAIYHRVRRLEQIEKELPHTKKS